MAVLSFFPNNVNVGRSPALIYELVNGDSSIDNIPTQAQADAGTTTTVQGTLNVDSNEFGTRSITVTFTVRADPLAAGHYSGQARAWRAITAMSFNASSGIFTDGETIIGKRSISSGNPFKENHPNVGSLAESGVYIKVTASFADKQLKLQDDGNLVLSDQNGSNITWSSGFVSSEEPGVVQNINPGVAYPPGVAGQCGKTLDDCKLRFGSGALPFGSFPSVGGNT